MLLRLGTRDVGRDNDYPTDCIDSVDSNVNAGNNLLKLNDSKEDQEIEK